MLLLPVLLPLVCGALLGVVPQRRPRLRALCTLGITLCTSALLLYCISQPALLSTPPLRMTQTLSLRFRADGLSRVFVLLIAVLWPLAMVYAFSYMEHEQNGRRFFAYYLMSYGVTAGIALSANLFTLYVCYELLTLVTLPLVLHKMDAASVHAGRKYLYYSIGGAALAFIGLVCIMAWGYGGTEFRYGGVLGVVMQNRYRNVLYFVYVLSFVGFGAKAALVPMQSWLPQVSVAPTPVTALLHAVAVVKAGAFAVIRVTYYAFGSQFLSGSWAQLLCVGLSAATIVYGSVMACKEQHLKRRLAWSTVSNLSYILLGAALLTQAGLAGALTHMLVHGVVKITLFFCVGAIMVRTGVEYIQDVRGFARLMPKTCFVFLVASCALVGVAPLPGFVSKWSLAKACVEAGPMGVVGLCALIVSAVLTAVYLFPVVVGMYLRPLNESLHAREGVNRDPDMRMLVPFGLLLVAMGVLCVEAAPLTRWLLQVAGGQ